MITGKMRTASATKDYYKDHKCITQDYASKVIGERQEYFRMSSHQYPPTDFGDCESIALENTNEHIVMPLQIYFLKKSHDYDQLGNLGVYDSLISNNLQLKH